MKNKVEVEVCQRASHLLEKITGISRKLDELPENAPLRNSLADEYEQKSAEYRRLIADIQEAQGQGILF